jgi:hypothetical protein
MMVALTLERHFAICSPHAYRIHIRTTRRCKHLAMYIIPVTALAIFCNVPMFLNVQVKLILYILRLSEYNMYTYVTNDPSLTL